MSLIATSNKLANASELVEEKCIHCTTCRVMSVARNSPECESYKSCFRSKMVFVNISSVFSESSEAFASEYERYMICVQRKL